VLRKLIADFVAPLVAVTLTLAAVFNSLGAILGQILPSRSGPTNISPGAAGASTYGAAGNSCRDFWSTASQKIGRCTAPSCRAGYSRAA
jgi:hypothetical protein